MNFFTPNYGAASSHIAELVKERDDFLEASRFQAARIQALEKENAALKDDLQTAHEQIEAQAVIATARAQQLEDQAEEQAETDAKVDKLRSTLRLLWGVLENQSTAIKEQVDSVNAGKELLVSLSDMLSTESSGGDSGGDVTDARTWARYAEP